METGARGRGRGRSRGNGHRRNGGNQAGHDSKLSRGLSRLLRHSAVQEGVAIRSDGYVKLKDVFALQRFQGYTLEQVQNVVKDNDKQRFSLMEEDGEMWIRANQGHSIKSVSTEELLEPIDPEALVMCVHGTYLQNWPSIKEHGMKLMSRNHMHFAPGLPGEDGVISGMRKSADVMIFLNLSAVKKVGLPLYKSSNGVILTSGFDIDESRKGVIPPCLFEKVVERNSGTVLFRGELTDVEDWKSWKPCLGNPGKPTHDKNKNQPKQKKAVPSVPVMVNQVLRRSSKPGLNVRPDGFVSVKELLNAITTGISLDELKAVCTEENGLTLKEEDNGEWLVRANVKASDMSYCAYLTNKDEYANQIQPNQGIMNHVNIPLVRNERTLPKDNEGDRVIINIDPASLTMYESKGKVFALGPIPSSSFKSVV